MTFTVFFCDCILETFKEFGIESKEGGVNPILPCIIYSFYVKYHHVNVWLFPTSLFIYFIVFFFYLVRHAARPAESGETCMCSYDSVCSGQAGRVEIIFEAYSSAVIYFKGYFSAMC